MLMLTILTSVGIAKAQNGNYAQVNRLNMYYETHGEKSDKQPIILLHGAYATLSLWGDFLTELSKSRQVVALDFQAHGRTADIDRPITYENMAYAILGSMILYVFVTMLGIHSGLNYVAGRTATLASLGTVFNLCVGIAICMTSKVSNRGAFQLQ